MADRSEIDEVRARTDIVSVIERYVTLKRAGRRFRGLCPFHGEKTPSFNVDPEAGYFKCFGCGEGGDVFQFVQKIENLTFPEALERLALAAGITLAPKYGKENAGQPNEPSLKERLLKINEAAQRYFAELFQSTQPGQIYARERGLHSDTIRSFQIGYSSEAWDGLSRYLRSQRLSLDDAEAAGLVVKNDDGSWRDRMRGRLVFPIHDVHGRPVAFGGRYIGEAAPNIPKYWNSPETDLFMKRNTLYGLGKARRAIAAQGYAIVVEGYMDVVTAHQHGFENTVASLGTSLTEEHARTLAPLARKVLLAFDADSAGLKAAFRAAEIFEARDMDVRVIDFPPGDDPDSLLRAGRRGELTQRIDAAVPVLEYQLRLMVRGVAAGEQPDLVELFRQLIPVLAKARNDVELDRYVRLVARYHPAFSRGSAAAEDRIRQDVVFYSREKAQAAGNLASPQPVTLSQAKRYDATAIAERHLIRALVNEDVTLAQKVAKNISADDFETEELRSLAKLLLDRAAEFGISSLALSHGSLQNEALQALLSDIVMRDMEPLTESMIEGEIDHLKTRSVMREQLALRDRINSGAATPQDFERFHQLQRAVRGGGRPPQAN